MNTDVIKLAQNKKYTEFSDSIKSILMNKLNNHDSIVKYATKYDNIQTMKSKFSEINATSQDDSEESGEE